MGKNFLDLVPSYNVNYSWQLNAKGRVEIKIRHQGFFAYLATKFFHRPAFTLLELEEKGSFVWQQINGQRSVYEIGRLLQLRYPLEQQSLYSKLCIYIKSLKQMELVSYRE